VLGQVLAADLEDAGRDVLAATGAGGGHGGILPQKREHCS
jgi:hypothetical protein